MSNNTMLDRFRQYLFNIEELNSVLHHYTRPGKPLSVINDYRLRELKARSANLYDVLRAFIIDHSSELEEIDASW